MHTLAEHTRLALLERYRAPHVRALMLIGSRARGDAGPYSDVDLKRLLFADTDTPPANGPGSELVDGLLVTISDVTPAQVDEWFTNPLLSLNAIAALREARALYDPTGVVEVIRQHASTFVWDEGMQRQAHAWVSEQMVGWVEEVCKGLEGLRRNDAGRLLNARHGLSWGLNHVAQVFLGVILNGENTFLDDVSVALGAAQPGVPWAAWRHAAFGVCQPDGAPITLTQQVSAGLRLYVAMAQLVDTALLPAHRPLVEYAVNAIECELGHWERTN
jgi:hypothetical protein